MSIIHAEFGLWSRSRGGANRWRPDCRFLNSVASSVNKVIGD